MLDQQSLTAYRQRWQAVAAVETTERQSASVDERWKQLNALLRIAVTLEFSPVPEETNINAGWQRWKMLTDHYLKSQGEHA